jgi:hypothetical protein
MSNERKTLNHRDRKNPRSAEEHAAKRKENNAIRGKQVWTGKEWVRQ